MIKTYTQQDINQFFNQFKELPNSYKLDKVHQLINNPDAEAMHLVKLNYKPLKFIIMTSAFIVGLSILLFWLTPEKKNDIGNLKHNIPSETGNPNSNVIKKRSMLIDETKKHQNQKIETDLLVNENSKEENTIPFKSITEPEFLNKPTTKKIKANSHIWPCDTTIERESMFVRLTTEELRNIGIIVKDGKSHYHNIVPNSSYDFEVTSLPENERIITYNAYYAWAFSNMSCEEYNLGNPDFYSVIDTLVPIIVDTKISGIYWFTPMKSLFDALPERYRYLNETIKNLKSLKQNCPDKSFVNYWIQGENVLDKIHYLELNKEELEKIQFRISNNKLVISDKKDINRIELFSDSGSSITGISSTLEFPPNPYPMAITDTLGRGRYITGVLSGQGSVNRANFMKNINALIAIKINLEDIIPPRKETLIFWFYPTDELIESLPDEIKYDIKTERDAIVKGVSKSTGSCTYFEACKSTLIVDDLTIYPNPADQSATIDFSLPESMTGKISIVSIAGYEVKNLVSSTTFLNGNNSFIVNLSDINPGIYLVLITTNKGFKTQRLIISR